jgi:hypothetical protein
MKHWKLVHKDEHKATLKHGNGHTMTLAIRSLHPGNQAELHKLPIHKDAANYAKGGKIKQQGPNNPKLAESKKLPHYDEGGGVQLADSGESVDVPQNLAPIDNPAPGAAFAQNQGQLPQDAAHAEAPFVIPPGNQQAAPSGQAPEAAPKGMAEAPKAESKDAGLPQPQDYAQQLQSATGQQVSGIQQQAAAEGQVAKDQQQVLNQQAQAQQSIAAHVQDVTAQHEAEIKSVVDDIKSGHIDPNRYLSNMNTAAKVGTGIGLILGGLGSGLTHGPNQAADFLNKQIDRDIEGQRAELGKKQNLVSLYSQMLGDERAGATLASQVLTHVTADQLQAAAAKSGNPAAQARAQQAIGALLASRAPEMQRLNMTQGLINATKSGSVNDPNVANQLISTMRVLDPEKAKEMESRYIPGVGMAQVPLTPATRDEITAKNNLDLKAKRLYDWASSHSGDLSPTDANIGRTMAAELQSDYRNSINGGVFKKGEQEFIDNIVDSDPTKFFNSIRVLPKLKEVIDSNQVSLNNVKKSAGLPVHEAPAQQKQLSPKEQSFLEFAKNNPGDPRSAQILKKLGMSR